MISAAPPKARVGARLEVAIPAAVAAERDYPAHLEVRPKRLGRNPAQNLQSLGLPLPLILSWPVYKPLPLSPDYEDPIVLVDQDFTKI